MRALLLAALASIGAHGPKLTTMQGTDAALKCPFASGVVCETAAGPGVSVATTRAGTATCIGGATVAANVACVSAGGLECFPSGVGGRTVGDVHKVSAAGFPVATADIRLVYRPVAATSAANRYLFDTRVDGFNPGVAVYIDQINGSLKANGGGGATVASGPLAWVADADYVIDVRWQGSNLTLIRNGAVVFSGVWFAPVGHGAVATIGARGSGEQQAEGSISLLRVGA